MNFISGTEIKLTRNIRAYPALGAVISSAENVIEIEKVIIVTLFLNLLFVQIITPNSFRVARFCVFVLYCKRYPQELMNIHRLLIVSEIAVINRSSECVSMLWLHRTPLSYVIVLSWRLAVARIDVCLPQSDTEKGTQAYDEDEADAAANEREICTLAIVRQLNRNCEQVERLYLLSHSTPKRCHL